MLAQDPSLAASDIEFSKKIIAKYHLAAWVTLELHEGQFTTYKYDRYPGKGADPGPERIKSDEGTFTRTGYKPWMRSDDWGETGSAISDELAQKLDMYADVTKAALDPGVSMDTSQGGVVWKYIGQTQDKNFTYYTYERSREHPRPGGNYPRYTVMKAAHDTDGQLFVSKMTADLRSGDARIPVTIGMIYLIPLPAGTKVEVFDQHTGKKKLSEVTGKDSGWEITTPQSAPPAGD